MPKSKKPPELDEIKRREILAILAMGSSRQAAAKYVGCAASTIRAAAQSDPGFAEQLRHAEQQAELNYLSNIRDAAKKPQYWRAAAWVLERRKPGDFASRKAGVMTVEQARQALERFAQIVVEEVPAARQRQRILARLDDLLKTLHPDRTRGTARRER
jgi:tRNA-dihydrouridine synthase